MKIYIQSKSGNYNTVTEWPDRMSLEDVFEMLRSHGYYKGLREKHDVVQEIVIPFEEIEHIRLADENDIY
jgi:hypothetical protein